VMPAIELHSASDLFNDFSSITSTLLLASLGVHIIASRWTYRAVKSLTRGFMGSGVQKGYLVIIFSSLLDRLRNWMGVLCVSLG